MSEEEFNAWVASLIEAQGYTDINTEDIRNGDVPFQDILDSIYKEGDDHVNS